MLRFARAVVLTCLLAVSASADFVRESSPMPLSDREAKLVTDLDASEAAYKAEYAELLTKTDKVSMSRRGTVKWHINHIPEVRRSWARIDMDRKVYWDDDPAALVVVSFMGRPWEGKTAQIAVYANDRDEPLRTATLGALTEAKVTLLLTVNDLPADAYRLVATVEGDSEPAVEATFKRAARRVEPIGIPNDGITIDVEPQDHLPDGEHAIVAGIPFPQGALRDVGELTLHEDGKPVASQMSVVSRWHATPDSSVRWAHLRFVARYRDGKPLAYTLRRGGNAPSAPTLTVEETDDQVTVSGGVLRFAVNRKAFNGIAAAWLNGKPVITTDDKTPAGPYIIDQRGIRYDARLDGDVEVTIEEAGPLRAVIAAKGWMTNPKQPEAAGTQKCQFVTRFTAWANNPQIDVRHYTVITFDTDRDRLRDVGFDVPVTGGKTWSLGLDGETQGGDLSEKTGSDPVFLHQYRWNRARLCNLPGEKKREARTIEGAKADGWFHIDAKETSGGVTAFVADMWRKFPKEVELSTRGMTIHAWPAHGISTFTPDEMYPKEQIYKLRWHHHGQLLDLRFPSEAYTALKEINWYDPEHMTEAAISGNAQGVAIAGHFALRFGPLDGDLAARAKLYEQNPHARVSGRWFAASRVEGRIAPRDVAHFPVFERDMDTFFPSYLSAVVEHAEEFGMFTYAGTHNNWYPHENRPQLHRVWQASHYRHVWEPWLHYLRGGPFNILRWARANTDRYMEIGTVNYAGGDVAAEIPWHQAGAMYHAKGFTPWGSVRRGQPASVGYKRIWGHHINADAHLIRWLVEADYRARDLHRMWVEAIANHNVPTGAGREACNTANEVLGYYRESHDPRMVPLLNDFADNMLKVPFDKWQHIHFPTFNPHWFMRMDDLMRDERIGQRLIEFYDHGHASGTTRAMIYWLTGRTDVLTEIAGAVYSRNRAIYFNEGDPLSGYRAGLVTDARQFHQQTPYWLAAMVDAGFDRIEPASDQKLWYPTWSKVYALDDSDRAFTMRIESPAQEHPFGRIAVTAPDGTVLVNEKMLTPETGRKSKYLGNDVLVYPIASDGQRGLYELEATAYISRAYAPYTDLPREAAVFGERAMMYGQMRFHTRTVSNKTPVDLTVTAIVNRTAANPVYLHIADANGKTVTDTSLLAGSTREQVTIHLDPTKDAQPYFFSGAGAAKLSTAGDDPRVAMALSAEAVTTIAARLRQ